MGEKVNLLVELRPGRPRDNEIEDAVLLAIKELEIATCEKVKRHVSQMLGKSVSWNTVKKYLEELRRRKIIRKQVLRNAKIESSVYRVLLYVG
jgi:hypothetical protein